MFICTGIHIMAITSRKYVITQSVFSEFKAVAYWKYQKISLKCMVMFSLPSTRSLTMTIGMFNFKGNNWVTKKVDFLVYFSLRNCLSLEQVSFLTAYSLLSSPWLLEILKSRTEELWLQLHFLYMNWQKWLYMLTFIFSGKM